jgi:hypothetical protein
MTRLQSPKVTKLYIHFESNQFQIKDVTQQILSNNKNSEKKTRLDIYIETKKFSNKWKILDFITDLRDIELRTRCKRKCDNMFILRTDS